MVQYSTVQHCQHLHPMLDPDVSDGPWISGHRRLFYKNCKNDTAALWDKQAAKKQQQQNYMNYKMSK